MSNAKEKIKEIATKEQKDAMKEMLRMVDKSKVDEVKQMLEYTQKGTAKATVGNYMVVLRNDPLVRESMKYNKLTGRIDIVKKTLVDWGGLQAGGGVRKSASWMMMAGLISTISLNAITNSQVKNVWIRHFA